MSSPWQNPLPLAEHTASPVIVYFYSDRWIPIQFFCLSEAIALYRKALRQGKELVVFPSGLKIETANILVTKFSYSLLPFDFKCDIDEF